MTTERRKYFRIRDTALVKYRVVQEDMLDYERRSVHLNQIKLENARAALFGLDQIVERYITLGNRALQQKERGKARRYIARGLRVMPGDARLLALQSRVDAPPVVASAPEASPPAPAAVEAEPKKNGLMSWLKTIFKAPDSTDAGSETPVDDYSF